MQKKALVVDSDFFFVEFLSELLMQRGYQVLKAYNGKEGIDKLGDDTVDILFADLILPKIDGRQLFKYIRAKCRGKHFPMVALSGTMIEQLGSLDEVGADYYIAKGPIDQLTLTLSEFIDKMETQTALPASDKKILTTRNVYPRRDAMELMNALHFHQAVIESAAVGLITIDVDTRILHANQAALDVIGSPSVDVLNRPVADLIRADERDDLFDGLRLVKRQPEIKKFALFSTYRSQVVGISVSAIYLKENFAGWTVAMELARQCASEP